MSNANFDTETNQAIAEAQALEAMFASSGWGVAEAALNEIINELRDARSIDTTRVDVAEQIKVNVAIADNLELWVADLRGRVNNVIMLQAEPEDSKLLTRR